MDDFFWTCRQETNDSSLSGDIFSDHRSLAISLGIEPVDSFLCTKTEPSCTPQSQNTTACGGSETPQKGDAVQSFLSAVPAKDSTSAIGSLAAQSHYDEEKKVVTLACGTRIDVSPLNDKEWNCKASRDLYTVFWLSDNAPLTDIEIFDMAAQLGFAGYKVPTTVECGRPTCVYKSNHIRSHIHRWNHLHDIKGRDTKTGQDVIIEKVIRVVKQQPLAHEKRSRYYLEKSFAESVLSAKRLFLMEDSISESTVSKNDMDDLFADAAVDRLIQGFNSSSDLTQGTVNGPEVSPCLFGVPTFQNTMGMQPIYYFQPIPVPIYLPVTAGTSPDDLYRQFREQTSHLNGFSPFIGGAVSPGGTKRVE